MEKELQQRAQRGRRTIACRRRAVPRRVAAAAGDCAMRPVRAAVRAAASRQSDRPELYRRPIAGPQHRPASTRKVRHVTRFSGASESRSDEQGTDKGRRDAEELRPSKGLPVSFACPPSLVSLTGSARSGPAEACAPGNPRLAPDMLASALAWPP